MKAVSVDYFVICNSVPFVTIEFVKIPHGDLWGVACEASWVLIVFVKI